MCLEEEPIALCLRLDILCEQKCMDMALRLVKACRKCLTDADPRFLEACIRHQVMDYLLDMDVILTYREAYRERSLNEFIAFLKQMTDEDGYNLVKRFMQRGSSSQPSSQASSSAPGAIMYTKRFKHLSLKIVELASLMFLTRASGVVPPSDETLSSLAIQYFSLQKSLNKSTQDLVAGLQKLMDNDFVTSKHMYIICNALSNQVMTAFFSFFVF